MNQFEKTLKLTLVATSNFVEVPHYHGAGRPSNDQKPDRFTYRIEGALASIPSIRMEQIQRKSCFILASNQLDIKALSDEQLIEAYKGQQKVERGFRFLKDPMFMACTMFLKSTKRIIDDYDYMPTMLHLNIVSAKLLKNTMNIFLTNFVHHWSGK